MHVCAIGTVMFWCFSYANHTLRTDIPRSLPLRSITVESVDHVSVANSDVATVSDVDDERAIRRSGTSDESSSQTSNAPSALAPSSATFDICFASLSRKRKRDL